MTQPDYQYLTEPRETWNLGVNTGAIRRAATAWQAISEAVTARADNLVAGIDPLLASEWEGEARASFESLYRRFVTTLDEAAAQARTVGAVLQLIDGFATQDQGRLDRLYEAVEEYISHSSQGDVVLMYRADEGERVRGLVDDARAARANYFNALDFFGYFGPVDRWQQLTDPWQGIASGATDPFVLPPDPAGTSVLTVDGEVVVNTGSGDDQVSVAVDRATGEVLVNVNGEVYRYPAGTPITLRTGSGNDVVEIPPDVGSSFVILGGRGGDTIRGGSGDNRMLGGRDNDRIFGGSGHDYVSGGSGNDYLETRGGTDLARGGDGADTIYTGDGSDHVSPGGGVDYADAGPGDDFVYAPDDADYASTGGGDDFVRGYGTVIRVEVPDTSDLSFITIDGSPEFQARVRADLATLRQGDTVYGNGSPMEGSREVMQSLADNHNGSILPGGHTITIREAPMDAETARTESDESRAGNRETVIYYNPVGDGHPNATNHTHAGAGSPAAGLLADLREEAGHW